MAGQRTAGGAKAKPATVQAEEAPKRAKPAPRQAKSTPKQSEAVRAVIEPVVAAAGLDLEGVQLQRAGSRLLLRVLVDRDGGVTLDEAAQAARELSEALDGSPVMGEQAYLLDVGSPGVDRPLTLLRHWRRNAGRLVRITMADGSVLLGRVGSASGEADDAPPARVMIGTQDGDATVEGAQVRRAVVQVEFGEAEAED